MYKTSTPAKRCCVLLFVAFSFLLGLHTKAQNPQIPRIVAKKWRMGSQNVYLTEDIKIQVEEQVAKLNVGYIYQNIEAIQNVLEWVRNYIHNHDHIVPAEYAYLAIIDHELIKCELSEQYHQWNANKAYWGLSGLRMKLLNLQNKLHEDKLVDEKCSLPITTEHLLKTFVQTQNYFENWTINICVLDWGYTAAIDKVQSHYGKNRNAYTNKEEFTLDFSASVLIEYFALRHVLEHLMHEEKRKGTTPSTHIACHSFDSNVSLRTISKKHKVSIENLKIYNGWLLQKKAPKRTNINWIIPTKRGYAYQYPELPEKIEEAVKKEKIERVEKEEKIEKVEGIVQEEIKEPDVENTTTEISHFYIVQPHDGLLAIARKHGITIEELRRLNPAYMHTDLIHPQVKLLIKAKSELEKKTFHVDKSKERISEGENQPNKGNAPKTYMRQIKRSHLQKNIEKPTQIDNRGGNTHFYPRYSPTQTIQNKIRKKSKR